MKRQNIKMQIFSGQNLKERAFLKLLDHLEFGTLSLTLPDGQNYEFTGRQPGPHGHLIIKHHKGLSRLISDGKMGFCEGYMADEIDSDNLSDLIQLAVLHDSFIEKHLSFGKLQTLFRKIMHWRNRNNKDGSRRNISYHYDLGNQFYAQWLDQTMTYSSAIFENEDEQLDAAQMRKYDRLAQLADIQPGDHVLEIGCGWGGFAEYAAKKYGAIIDGITISQAQHDFAKNRIDKAGLGNKATIRICDYRDVTQRYDKIISIEMFEAVGERYWPVYFEKISKCLKPGGKAALQVITIDDNAFYEYQAQPDFIQKYIFPGGMLPSMKALTRPITHAGLALRQHDGFGRDYALTLAVWREQFLSAWPELRHMQNFDERFKRMWELYLSYCEGGFRAGMIDVKQLLISHK
jgi:cyclopropane-fatty-acyl-phospholipid synthase